MQFGEGRKHLALSVPDHPLVALVVYLALASARVTTKRQEVEDGHDERTVHAERKSWPPRRLKCSTSSATVISRGPSASHRASQAARRPGGQAARQPDSQTVRQSDSQTARQPDSQTAGSHGGPTCDAHASTGRVRFEAVESGSMGLMNFDEWEPDEAESFQEAL